MCVLPRQPGPASAKPSKYLSPAVPSWDWVWPAWLFWDLGGLFILLKAIFAPGAAVDSEEMTRTIEVLTGFSLGAESIALFARVGGGIYTKAADVGADLVGKVEAGIPEDDPRNPATIADNVGDNVGDVAGMGADLFGSYVATVLATMVLGRETQSDDAFGGMAPILFPMFIAGVGILFSIVGTLFVRISDTAKLNTSVVQKALNMGNWGSIVLTALACIGLVYFFLPETMVLRGIEFTKWGVLGAIGVGLLVGTLMSIITEYYTAMGKGPVLSIIRQSGTGHATNVIGGLAIGMQSTFPADPGPGRRYLGLFRLCRPLWRRYRSSRYDGYYSHAAGHRCLRPYCR
jgi:K(+)-stimulated pyrophosphate-energized sodium pump